MLLTLPSATGNEGDEGSSFGRLLLLVLRTPPFAEIVMAKDATHATTTIAHGKTSGRRSVVGSVSKQKHQASYV